MILELSLFSVIFLVLTSFLLVIAVYVWNRRSMPGGLYFSLLMLACAEYSFFCLLEYMAVGLPDKILFHKLTGFGALSIAPLWLLFVIDYGYQRSIRITKKYYLLWVVPAVLFLVGLTNEWHGLMWTSMTLNTASPDHILALQYGVAFWASVVYYFILTISGVGLLLLLLFAPGKKNFPQVVVILVGAFVPFVASIAFFSGYNPFHGLEYPPYTLSIAAVLNIWAIYRMRIFDLVPIARDTLMTSMSDGVVVVDETNHIVDINPAGKRMLNTTERVIGQKVGLVIDVWNDLIAGFESGRETTSEVMIPGKAGPQCVEVRMSALVDPNGCVSGKLVILRDITRRKHAEESLKLSNSLLQAEVAERKHAEEKLTGLLTEKNILLKEIHHRVKNNLQIVSSLLNLQSSSGSTDTAILFRESQNRIKSMALIHEKLYQSTDFSRINFREYVRSLIVSLSRTYITDQRVRIDTDIDDLSLDIDRAIPCGLIINELVTNCLKYAFRDGRAGLIKVHMSRADNLYTLIISDDGVGMPSDIDFRDTTTIGLQLVVTLTEQLGGKIDLAGEPGTTFRITFGDVLKERPG